MCLKFDTDRPLNEFENLVEDIKRVLGPSSGINSADVDVKDLIRVMERYTSDESHWGGFALEDLSRNYTRNFVDHGNGKANLLILVWTPGKGSPVHDHADAHCIMKILKGKLQETLYEIPSEVAVDQPLKVEKVTVYGTDEVTYISDDIGLHRVENPDPENIAVSLHLYTPPWAEKRGCYCFCPKTGKKNKVQMSNYYSVQGKIEKIKGASC
ncbi:cysteine dioxygenase [Morchella conica CCBAS932]|uniref:Cysteine dioxygenase n=2 Tax=Morchella sect. Distantes TaxID=1051054 RepID=A0A3N4KY19_9PEZI|nr:cysteine dioxygenase [Morchella conica CCBAS932]